MQRKESPIKQRLLSTTEAAKYLGIHYMTLREWALAGKIPVVRIGSKWKFDLYHIDRLIGENTRRLS